MMRMRLLTCSLLGSVLVIGGARALSAQSCPRNQQPLTGLASETVVFRGPSDHLIDLVFVGDGYRAADLPTYHDHVDFVVRHLFGEEPFIEYAPFFNVHRVDVISPQTGTDFPRQTPPLCRDTALNTGHLPCLQTRTFDRVAEAAGNARNERNEPLPLSDALVLVLVNDPNPGGCTAGGYAFAAIRDAAAGPPSMAHEFGHAFGHLGDEYISQGRYTGPDPIEPNRTIYTSRDRIKWGVWVEPSTPLPTECPSAAIGAFEGAFLRFGVFRPTCTSKMLSNFQPWREVNTEWLVKMIYAASDPILEQFPDSPVSVLRGQRPRFALTHLQPATGTLDVSWSVDGQLAGSGTEVRLTTADLALGSHRVEALVSDPTPWVRNRTGRFLPEATAMWDLYVVSASGDLNGDGRVTIDELIRAIGFALGTVTPSEEELAAIDRDGNRRVTIDELVTATDSALASPAGSQADARR
jgi:IgA Peptidase M64